MPDLFASFQSRPGADEEQISNAQRVLRVRFPAEYAEFLRVRNGGEGLVGQTFVVLWDVSELGQMNRAYEPDVWAPACSSSEQTEGMKASVSIQGKRTYPSCRFHWLACVGVRPGRWEGRLLTSWRMSGWEISCD